MIVSTALLGIGAAGTYLVLHTYRWHKPSLPLLVISPLLFSVTTLGSYLILNHIPFDLVRLEWDMGQLGYIMLAYGVLAIPFFFSGLTVVTALFQVANQAGKVYFSDLFGASTGAILPLLLYPVIGPTGAIIMAAFLGLAAAIILWWSLGLRKISSTTAVLFSLSLLLLAGPVIVPSWYQMRLSPYKGLNVALRYPDAQHLSTHWSVLSRIDVVRSPAVRFAPGLSLTYPGRLPPQIGFSLDGDQLYAVTDDQDMKDLTFLRYLPSTAPYSIHVPQNVLIMEPGGGLDVLTALYFNVPSVVVIEKNPALPDVVRQPAPDFTTRIYEDLRVRLHLTEPRSYLSATDDTYDLIVLSPLHTLGASTLGLHGFAEEYSMTQEAIKQYYQHLSGHGWLMMTRYLQPIPLQETRLVATLIETLEDLGLDAHQRLVAIRSWGTLTLLLKHDIITHDEIQKLKTFSENLRFDLDYYPGILPGEANRFNRFPQAIYYQLFDRLLDPKRRADLYRDYPFDIQPVTDDRPFFGYVLKWGSLKEAYDLAQKKWLFLINSGLLVLVMLIQAIFFAVILILMPAGLGTKPVKTSYNTINNIYILLYYMLIAFSFMGVEIAMIQRLVLFLGHPVYAVSIVLGGLLLFAGLGSLLTHTDFLNRKRPVRPVLLILSLVVMVVGISISEILPYWMSLSMEGRLWITAVLLAPLGILMGMPFPLGITYLKNSKQEGIIPWVWAANGSVSVVAAIFTVMLAMEIGFTGVFLMAALAYLLAAWIWGRVLSQKDVEAS